MRLKIENLYKSKVFKLLSAVVFLYLLFLVFCRVTYLLRYTGYDRNHMVGIKEEKDLDMVYIGGSAAFTYWQPLKAWNDCGFTSYSFATNSIHAENLKAYIEESERYHHPVLYVIDVRPFQYYSDSQLQAGIRNGSDGLDITSSARYHLLNEYFSHKQIDENTDVLSYYFDIAKYHTNLANLGSKTAWGFENNRGISPNKGWEWFPLHEYKFRPIGFETEERAELMENDIKTLENLLQFCKKRNLEALFVVCPYVITMEDQSKYNTIKDLIEEYGYTFLNTNLHYDEIGIDYGWHLYNDNHTNPLGAIAYTEYLERYIMEHYAMPDHRGDQQVSASWNQDYQRFRSEEKKCIASILDIVADKIRGKYILLEMKDISYFPDWYNCAMDERYTLLITSKGENIVASSDLERNYLSNWSIKEGEKNIIRSVCGNKVLYTNREDKTRQLSGNVGNSYYSVGLDDGGNSYLTIGEHNYIFDSEGIHITVLDNNFKSIVAQFQLKNQSEQGLHVVDWTDKIESISQHYGLEGREIDIADMQNCTIHNSRLVYDQYLGKTGIHCKGNRQNITGKSSDTYEKKDNDGSGFSLEINDIGSSNLILFYEKCISDKGESQVRVYDGEGKLYNELLVSGEDMDHEWHQHIIDVSQMKGKATVVFNVGCTEDTDTNESEFIFTNLYLY